MLSTPCALQHHQKWLRKRAPGAEHHADLKPQEGERVERLARVIATAEQVWGSIDDTRVFLATAHAMRGGKRPIDLAMTEPGARRVENLLGRTSMARPRKDPVRARSKAAVLVVPRSALAMSAMPVRPYNAFTSSGMAVNRSASRP